MRQQEIVQFKHHRHYFIIHSVLYLPHLTVSGTLTGTSSLATSLAGGTVGQVLTSATNIAGGTAGRIPYQSGESTTLFTSSGTLGQVLTSQGIAAPTWMMQKFLP